MARTSWATWSAVAAGSLLMTLAAWLASASGLGLPRWASQGVVLWLFAWIGLGVALAIRRGLRSESSDRRAATWLLIALTAASFAARWVGLGFELTTHFHNDEGTFLKTARQILEGELLPTGFHYPHLLYYSSSLTLWIGGLFPSVAVKVAAAFGVPAEEASVLLLRLMTASLSALTTIPVFLAARRVAGLWAGFFAGGLIALSPTYNEVSHLAISDVPSGLFAALTLACVARLLDRETLGDYLLAGVAAAFAAASKYPAGVSAVAIVGIWVYWRLRRRDFNLLLLWSGLISVATLLVIMPALWLRFEFVFGGPGATDILFGYRQYAERGWIGVVTDNNAIYYAGGLAAAFGIVATLLGSVGIFLLPAENRRRALWMGVFPLAFLALLMTMDVAVKRNLQPLLPAVAIVLGSGLAAWPPLLRRPRQAWRIALVAVAALLQPAFGTVAWDVSQVRPGTRQLAVEWIDANIPQGASFIKEAYTPPLHFRRYAWTQARYAARLTLEEIRDPRWDYLLLSRNAHLRFLTADKHLRPHHQVFADRYAQIFDEFELVRRFRPGRFRSGPDLLLYRLDPPKPDYVDLLSLSVADVDWVSEAALEPAEGAEAVRFFRKGQSVLFKEHLKAGTYTAVLDRQPPEAEAWLYVVSRDNHEVGEIDLTGPEPRVLIERADKYFLRVFLSPGAELRSLRIAPASDG